MKKRMTGWMASAVGLLTLASAGAPLALARERLRVVDDTGRPVENAHVSGAFSKGHGLGDQTRVNGLTASDGVFTAGGLALDEFGYRVEKAGYYATQGSIRYGVAFSDARTEKNGRWEPFGLERTVVLRRKVNPVVPGHVNVGRKIPAYGRWLGFDLERADFTGSYGQGAADDVLLRFTDRGTGDWDFTCTMEVSFTNNPYAGAYLRRKDAASELSGDYAAQTNGLYKTSFLFETSRTKAGIKTWNPLGADSYLVVRTRTRVDDEGRLVSAHYGRLDGPWKFHECRGMSLSGVLFNPRANDPNLEPVRPLFGK